MKKIFFITLIIGTMLSSMVFFGKSHATGSGPDQWEVTRHLEFVAGVKKQWLNTSRELSPEDLKGRVILLDFWTFCCINCMHVIPDLHYLEKKFGDKLTVIGVHSAKFANEKDVENIRNAVLRYDIEHPVVNDFDFRIWQSFGVHAWPTFVLIAPNGKIKETYSGEGNRDAVEEDISELLEEYKNVNTAPLPIELEKNKVPQSILSFPGKLEYIEGFDAQDAIFVSDSGYDRVLGIRPDGKIFTEIGNGQKGLKDGTFADAQFNSPQGILYDNGKLYIADTNNHALRVADFATKTVSTIAGTGKQGYRRNADNDAALETPLASPWDLEFFPDKKHIVMAMAGTHQLWNYNIENKTVSVVAGNGREFIDDGKLPFNSLSQPSGLSAVVNKLYFVDSETSSLRVMDSNYNVTTLIGTGLFDFGFADGNRKNALLQHPIGVFGTLNQIYIADSYNHAIRVYDLLTEELSTLVANSGRTKLNEPNDVTLVNGNLYITSTNDNQIKIFNIQAGTMRNLEVMPQEKSNAAVSETLPNVKSESMVVGKDLAVKILLSDGWKINEQAPSWAALFDDSGNVIKEYGLEEVRKDGISFSGLKDKGNYRFQGTFFYCEKYEGAQCMVQSYDGKLTVDTGMSGKSGAIEVDLRQK